MWQLCLPHWIWQNKSWSRALHACIVAHMCNNWQLYTLLTSLPAFMKSVLKFDIKSVSIIIILVNMCATIQAWRARDLTMSFHGAFPVYTKMLVQFNSSWYITVWTIQFICGLYMHCGKLIYPSGALEFILVLWGLFCSPFSFCLVFCSSLLAFFLGHCISCPSIDLASCANCDKFLPKNV
jgi:hypothetical protein